MYNVLFIDLRNAARSVIAESVLTKLGRGRFQAYSAGSQPGSEVHPYVRDILFLHKMPVDNLRPKGWDSYISSDVKFDFVFAVDEALTHDRLPQFPGQPMVAYWAFPDPTLEQGTEALRRAAFADVYGRIHNRLSIFVNLPIDALGRLALKHRLEEMAQPVKTSAA